MPFFFVFLVISRVSLSGRLGPSSDSELTNYCSKHSKRRRLKDRYGLGRVLE
jgi:hypothetical protein